MEGSAHWLKAEKKKKIEEEHRKKIQGVPSACHDGADCDRLEAADYGDGSTLGANQ